MPTNFFTPQVPAPVFPPDGVTDEGPVPQAVDAPRPTIITQPGIEPETTTSMPSPVRRRLTHATETFPGPGQERSRTVGLVAWALLAMVLGAAGGVLVYRALSVQRAPQTVGLGRLSIETDRPAEVKLGDEILKAPFADVYLAAGHHAVSVREGSGPWKGLEIDVVADKPTKLEVKLDSLAPIP